MAAFPWTVGDQTYKAMTKMYEKYKNFEVAPLTGFDSGMVLYHTSVVDFFIPYMPRGEGGFSGKWSLCAHYLNLFAPLVFKSHALRINALQYRNLINFDNLPETEKKKKQEKRDTNGLIILGESRHPYEYHLNAPFRTFMSAGLRNPRMRWGRHLTTYDVYWGVSKGTTPYSKWDILEALNDFYDIKHPLIAHNMYIKQKFSQLELDDYAQSNLKFKFIIHIFTMNRLVSFERLWECIVNAYPIAMPVTIQIHMDFDEQDIVASLNYIKYLKSLQSHHGPVVLNVNTKPKGLRYNILDSWMPMSTDEYAIFLEDDITVSARLLSLSRARSCRSPSISSSMRNRWCRGTFTDPISTAEFWVSHCTISAMKRSMSSSGRLIPTIPYTYTSSLRAGERYTGLYSM